MHITYIGLGKMGHNMVERLIEKGHTVTAYDPDESARARAAHAGARVTESISALMEHDRAPRTIWIMVPHQVVDEVLKELSAHLERPDTIIEGGNSPFKKPGARARARQ